MKPKLNVSKSDEETTQ